MKLLKGSIRFADGTVASTDEELASIAESHADEIAGCVDRGLIEAPAPAPKPKRSSASKAKE